MEKPNIKVYRSNWSLSYPELHSTRPYVAEIYMTITLENGDGIEGPLRKQFKTRQEALAWIDKELEGEES